MGKREREQMDLKGPNSRKPLNRLSFAFKAAQGYVIGLPFDITAHLYARTEIRGLKIQLSYIRLLGQEQDSATRLI